MILPCSTVQGTWRRAAQLGEQALVARAAVGAPRSPRSADLQLRCGVGRLAKIPVGLAVPGTNRRDLLPVSLFELKFPSHVFFADSKKTPFGILMFCT